MAGTGVNGLNPISVRGKQVSHKKGLGTGHAATGHLLYRWLHVIEASHIRYSSIHCNVQSLISFDHFLYFFAHTQLLIHNEIIPNPKILQILGDLSCDKVDFIVTFSFCPFFIWTSEGLFETWFCNRPGILNSAQHNATIKRSVREDCVRNFVPVLWSSQEEYNFCPPCKPNLTFYLHHLQVVEPSYFQNIPQNMMLQQTRYPDLVQCIRFDKNNLVFCVNKIANYETHDQ